jgi:glycolate oxidase
MLRSIGEISDRTGIRIANVFHAGDGNLHPVLLYDERQEAEVTRVLEASAAILDRCLELGGSLTGEHGIGVEKLGFMERAFTPDSLEAMRRIRAVFDPEGRANPGKAIPAGGGCADPAGRPGLDRRHPGRQAPQ